MFIVASNSASPLDIPDTYQVTVHSLSHGDALGRWHKEPASYGHEQDVEAGKLPGWGFQNYQQRLRPMVSRIKQALREAEDLRLGSTGSSAGTASTGGGFSDAPSNSCNTTSSWRPHRLESTTGIQGNYLLRSSTALPCTCVAPVSKILQCSIARLKSTVTVPSI
jgi:hypothetical protein